MLVKLKDAEELLFFIFSTCSTYCMQRNYVYVWNVHVRKREGAGSKYVREFFIFLKMQKNETVIKGVPSMRYTSEKRSATPAYCPL